MNIEWIYNPYALSAPFAIDPAYAVDACVPSKESFALWSVCEKGPAWLYIPGGLEAFLFDRTRCEAYATCLNVYHPGRFSSFSPMLYAYRDFDLQEIAETVSCVLHYNGIVHVAVNNHRVIYATNDDASQSVHVDIASYLVQGKNRISVRLTAQSDVPCFCLDADVVESDYAWQVSNDDLRWVQPRCVTFIAASPFPHREQLPELTLPLHAMDGQLFDAGQEVLGRIAVTAKSPGSCTLFAGESQAEAMNAVEDVLEQVTPTLAFSSAGMQYTQEKLAFRYLRVDADCAVEQAAVHLSLYPTQYRGAFACADERLSRIWMHAAYTLRASMQLTYVDGLKRDRLPWVGDIYACNLGNFHVFNEQPVSEYSLAALMGQNPDEVDLNGIICYSLFWVLAARDHVLYFSESAFSVTLLPFANKLINSLEQKLDENGLLPSKGFDWIYVDWAEVHDQGYCCFLNCLAVMALDAAADLHRELSYGEHGRSQELRFRAAASRLREQSRAAFWNAERTVFVDNHDAGIQGQHVGRQSNALAVLSDVCLPEQRQHVLDNVFFNDDVAPVGTPYMKLFEARALARCAAHQNMLDTVSDYWGGMIDQGATTFWEGHDASLSGEEHYAFYGRKFAKSLCHAWSSGPLHILSADLCGLRPLSQGWREFTAQLACTDLEWIATETSTPYGPIQIQIHNDRAQISVPSGTRMHYGIADDEHVYAGPCTVDFKLRAAADAKGWHCLGRLAD